MQLTPREVNLISLALTKLALQGEVTREEAVPLILKINRENPPPPADLARLFGEKKENW